MWQPARMEQRGAVGAAIASGALFGTAGTAAALAPAGATPLGVGWVRLVGGALVLLAAVALRRPLGPTLVQVWRHPLTWLAAVGAAGYQVCFFAATHAASVALATLVTVGSAPIFAGALAWLVLHHRPHQVWFVATTVCLGGLGLASWSGLRSSGLGPAVGLGIALSLGAGLSIATYTVSATRLMEHGVGQLTLMTGAYLAGGVMLAPLALHEPFGWVAQLRGAAAAAYLAVATMALANLLYLRGLQRLSPGPTATLVLTDPVVAALLGVLVLGEHLDPPALLGFGLVLAGLALQAFRGARAEVTAAAA